MVARPRSRALGRLACPGALMSNLAPPPHSVSVPVEPFNPRHPPPHTCYYTVTQHLPVILDLAPLDPPQRSAGGGKPA